MAMIETVNLTKNYNKFEALKGLNLSIEKGDIFGFIGPNGAGKTTTIRILSTLLQPTMGKALIDGVDVMRNPYEIKKIIGYMPDSFGVYDGMRLREYLDFFGAAYKIPSKQRKAIIDDVLERMAEQYVPWPRPSSTIPRSCCSMSQPADSIPGHVSKSKNC